MLASISVTAWDVMPSTTYSGKTGAPAGAAGCGNTCERETGCTESDGGCFTCGGTPFRVALAGPRCATVMLCVSARRGQGGPLVAGRFPAGRNRHVKLSPRRPECHLIFTKAADLQRAFAAHGARQAVAGASANVALFRGRYPVRFKGHTGATTRRKAGATGGVYYGGRA